MNNILLCEGATDAILLSYYLEAVFGWMYCCSSLAGMAEN